MIHSILGYMFQTWIFIHSWFIEEILAHTDSQEKKHFSQLSMYRNLVFICTKDCISDSCICKNRFEKMKNCQNLRNYLKIKPQADLYNLLIFCSFFYWSGKKCREPGYNQNVWLCCQSRKIILLKGHILQEKFHHFRLSI